MEFRVKLLLFFSFILLAIYIIRVIPVSGTPDTYYYLAVGRQVFQERKIPQGDNFTYGVDSKNISSTWWLSGLIFFLFYKYLGGINSLYLLRLIFSTLTLYILYKTMRLIDTKGKLSILLTTIAVFTLTVRLNDRPEIFSFLFLATVNYFCLNYFLKRKYNKFGFFLPLIFFLWPSFHGLVSLGIAIFAFYSGLIFLEKKISKVIFPKYNLFQLTFLISGLLSIIQYQRLTSFTLQQKFSVILTEWVSFPASIENQGGYLFIQPEVTIFPILILIYLITFIYFLKREYKNKKSWGLITLFSFYLLLLLSPIKFVRLIQAIVLLSLPVLLLLISKITKTFLYKSITIFLKAYYSVALIFIICGIITGTFFASELTIFIKNKTSNKQILGYWENDFPTKLPNVINSNLNSKRVFTSNYWDSYFIWSVPKAKYYSDVVFENTTATNLTEEFTLASGKEGWGKLLDTYQIDTVINSQSDSSWGNFTPVYKLNNWKLFYVDSIASVYAKNDIINKTPVDLSVIHLELPTDLKFEQKDTEKALEQLNNLLLFDNTNAFARIQLIEYYRDHDLEKAEKLAQESRNLIKKNAWFSLLLSSVYSRKSDCQNTKKYALEAVKKSSSDTFIKSLTNTIIDNCDKPK